MHEILVQYQQQFQQDQALAKEAKAIFPDGINSDSRYMLPHPVYMDRANGARKWDLSGREYIDYWAGHGALLFGHNPPEIVAAVTEQIRKGVHFGACHPLEIKWGKLVQELIPSAERIRFTNSGTEANQQAVQLARAHTGKHKLLVLEGSYHGWLHPVFPTEALQNNRQTGQADTRIICPPNDIAEVEKYLSSDPDIACILLEPTGPCSGVVPINGLFLKQLRELTQKCGVVLIFDEVITGFRVSAGGAQAHYKVTPDLTSLGKILTGGLPGGAVTGKKEIMNLISFDEKLRGEGRDKIAHYGTFSANPLSAASGIAMLELIKAKNPYERLNKTAKKLRTQLNELFTQHDLDWVVYGEFSCLKFIFDHGQNIPANEFDPSKIAYQKLLKRGDKTSSDLIQKSLLINGIDLSLSSVVTTAHEPHDIQKTLAAFEKVIHQMKKCTV